jgi:hypothetical protein
LLRSHSEPFAMESSPHVGRNEDLVEKLRVVGKEVDRAVAVAKRVREEVEPALSDAETRATAPYAT